MISGNGFYLLAKCINSQEDGLPCAQVTFWKRTAIYFPKTRDYSLVIKKWNVWRAMIAYTMEGNIIFRFLIISNYFLNFFYPDKFYQVAFFAFVNRGTETAVFQSVMADWSF